MTKTINIKSVNWSKLHIYCFYLFLFSIPFQTRKVFLTQHSFYSGAFTEYATFFVYASDVFLISTLFFWLISIPLLRGGWGCVKIAKSRKIQIFLFVFIVWLIISATINNKYLEISVFQIIKVIELFLLLVYIYFNLANKKALLTSLFIISLAGFLQSLIAIYQFIFQQSLFNSPILAKITGEVVISPQIPGIAKIVVDGEKMVRAYGTFPHPNVLGGFLILSSIISIYLLLEHKYAILSRYKLSYIQFYNIKFKKSQVQTAISLIWIAIIFVQITALLFTFSRSAWAGFAISIITLLFLLYISRSNNVSRETISDNQKLCTFCHSDRSERGTSERSGGICRHNLFSLIKYLKIRVYPLTDPSAPIVARDDKLRHINHKNSNNVSRETLLEFKGKLNCYLLAIFVSFLVISLFDHYFWTLQQGRLIFWLILGMLLIDVRFKAKDN